MPNPSTTTLPVPYHNAIHLIAAVTATLNGPATRRCYAGHLRRYFEWLQVGGYTINRFSVDMYTRWLIDTGVSQATANQALAAIKKAAEVAHDSGAIALDTYTGIARIKTHAIRGRRTGKWLDVASANMLIASVRPTDQTQSFKDIRDGAVIALMLGCALRREEAAQVTWEQYQDWSNGTTGIPDGRKILANVWGKGNKLRSVAVPEWAKQLIDTWDRALIEYYGDDSGVYPTKTLLRSIDRHGNLGESLSPNAIYNIVRDRSARLGIEIRPHDLRRTAAKLARKGGAEVDAISKWLGHSSITVTERYLNADDGLDKGTSPGDRTGLK